jgi:ABC-type multidrug transport system ATPase subunit
LTAPLEVREIARLVRTAGAGPEILLLDLLSFELGPGRILGLTGPREGGARVALRVVAGLDPRSHGQILLDGRRAEDWGWPEFRALVSTVPEDLGRLGGRAEPLLRALPGLRGRRRGSGAGSPLGGAARDLAQSAISRVAESPVAARLAWAAALAVSGSRYLLLEEPTRGARPGERQRACRELRMWAGAGLGLLLQSSDEVLLATLAEEIIVLYDGREQVRGTPAELLPAAMGLRDGTAEPRA